MAGLIMNRSVSPGSPATAVITIDHCRSERFSFETRQILSNNLDALFDRRDKAIIGHLHLACSNAATDNGLSIKAFFNNTQKKSAV